MSKRRKSVPQAADKGGKAIEANLRRKMPVVPDESEMSSIGDLDYEI